ncbi:YolD-like family protein [Cytobacillus sp. IB215665]|uniref:YolD-like family protein n=1 Tax=Cytobacillus sp. IB215665 TaxID=3097357 RepID=UPI002A0E061A|nr:YolD-like family protein [Cytobacillus sp. IB215665]MDX8366806.1 YolD-like family protein [Cytobacillus sp. IB215665]
MKGSEKMKEAPAYMQPEEIKLLKDAWDDYSKIQKTTLNEYEIEEIKNKILEALEFKQEVTITYTKNGTFKPCVGHIYFVDKLNKHIMVIDNLENVQKFKFERIINVQIN